MKCRAGLQAGVSVSLYECHPERSRGVCGSSAVAGCGSSFALGVGPPKPLWLGVGFFPNAIDNRSYNSNSARIMLSSRLENILHPSRTHIARISRFSGSIFEITLLSFSSRAKSTSR